VGENVRGRKKGVMEQKTVGEEEVDHFLLEKVRELRMRGQPKREGRANATRGTVATIVQILSNKKTVGKH
jgi:hypothetical protein